MANPFLMMDDDVSDEADQAINPFLMQDEPGAEEDEYENPFTAQANNPFAFGDEPDDISEELMPDVTTNAQIFDINQPPITTTANKFQSIDAAMSFFGTTIEADDDPISVDIKPSINNSQLIEDSSAVYSSEDELTRKTGPPPRPTPPSQTTQDLIFSVADHLDQASSQLLGRLPATRSPSPVSMRDLNSPCPTPDSAMVDFFDISDSGPSSGQGFDMDIINSGPGVTDNPFAPTSIPSMQATSPLPPSNKTQPSRPPRPAPPRPAPPSVPSAPVRPAPPQLPNSQQQPSEPDLFDMFGTSAPPKPPPPKTTQDILNLFQTHKPIEQPAQDLLGGDNILDAIPNEDTSLPAPFTENMTASQQVPQLQEAIQTVEPESTQKLVETTEVAVEEPIHVEPIPEPAIAGIDPVFTSILTEPEDHSEEPSSPTNTKSAAVDDHPVKNKIIPVVNMRRAPTPDIEITTVESLPRSDDEEEEEVQVPPPRPPPPQRSSEPDEPEIDLAAQVDVDSEKAESDITSPPTDSLANTNAMDVSPMDFNNSSFHASEPELMDTGLDFAPASGVSSANPFASPDDEGETYFPPATVTNIFASPEGVSDLPTTVPNLYSDPIPIVTTNIFASDDIPTQSAFDENNAFGQSDEFDAFSAKFDSVKKDNVSLLDGFGGTTPTSGVGGDAWGGDGFGCETAAPMEDGFGAEDDDPFLSMAPVTMQRSESIESVDKEFSVVIRPKADGAQGVAPILAPPPPPPRGSQNNSIYSGDSSPRVNPFDKNDEVATATDYPAMADSSTLQRTDSQESPQTPLFDDDVSQPLEDFPRINFVGEPWEMQLRQPNKKKITGQRFWKKIFVKMTLQGDMPAVQLFSQLTDKQPFQELPLQPSYSVSEIASQQFDQFGKIFTMKLQYIFYKERPGVRPGQVTKAERITNKLSQFAAYAIQGDYQGVKEFGSDLKKLGLPVEHAPQSSQLFKIGSMSYEDLKQFSVCIEESLFKLPAHRDRALNYKMEEVQVTAVDEIYVEQDAEGLIVKQIARVRLFFLAFLTGMPTIELGLNDMWRQGKEVVGRHDIIPVVTEEWIRLEGVEFHNTVSQEEYERSRTIRFQPPDACYIELMRFRVRPPKNRELPLQLKATWCVTGNRVELRADILVPGFASRKLGQIPCEDVSVRFPIPECWIYLFRVEKHFRYGSVKSAHRRTGKIKGIERILGAVDQLQESLIEVTSGQAKYEHNHRAIVWRCPRLPKEGQGAYTTHQMVCRMALTSYDQIPDQLAPFAFVEFTMPATQVSHTTVRSVSVQDSDSDDPPEKYVRYLARHEYRVGIETTHGETTNAYLAATRPIKEEPRSKPAALSPMPPSESDSDSN